MLFGGGGGVSGGVGWVAGRVVGGLGLDVGRVLVGGFGVLVLVLLVVVLLLWWLLVVAVVVIEFGGFDGLLVLVAAIVVVVALLDVGVDLKDVKDGLGLLGAVLLGDRAAGQEAGPLLGQAGECAQADVDLVDEVGGVGDAHEGRARVDVVHPAVELLIVLEGKVEGSLVSNFRYTIFDHKDTTWSAWGAAAEGSSAYKTLNEADSLRCNS